MKLVFLTYLPRSGSTFLISRLYQFDQFIICPEGEVLVKKLLYKPNDKCKIDIKSLFKKDKKLICWNINPMELKFRDTCSRAEIFIRILKIYQKNNQALGKIIVFKAYELINIIDQLHEEFIKEHNLKFIILMRDGRAVYHSQSRTIYRGSPLGSNPIIVAKRWSHFAQKSNVVANSHNISLIKFSNLIQNPEKTIKILFKELWPEIRFTPVYKQSSFFENIPKDQRSMHYNINKVPNTNIITEWSSNLSSEELYVFERIAEKQLIIHGYPLKSIPVPMIHKIIILLKYHLKRYFSIIEYWLSTT